MSFFRCAAGAESAAFRLKVLAFGALAGMAVASAAHAEVEAQGAAGALGSLSLDELSQIDVTSVSKRPEPVGQAASSVYVITGDAIRRSGALSIPEALRQAPNLEVVRIDALDYSITARGFGGAESANKLLVLIDGRSVYNPLFSGVDWDQHHLVLDDVDRIEVISGPAGAIWGANAVNGVVNVTSRSAFDTLGGLASFSVGTLDRDLRLRYGAPIGDLAAGRVYVTAVRRGDLDLASGAQADDGWNGVQAGFRLDSAGGPNTFTLQGDAFDNHIGNSLGFGSGYTRGGNVLGRWTRPVAGGRMELQAYYDQFSRTARGFHDELRTYDVSAQHAFSLGERQNLVVGGGYRITRDQFRTLAEPQLLTPLRRRVDIGNVFAQDEIALRADLLLTLGLKVETNTYTRAELMPNARLAWRVTEHQFLWGAVSRAIRNPSRIERDFIIAGVVDPGHMGSEKLVAYELGYRGRVTSAANVSVSLFYNDYDELRTNDLTAPGVLPIRVGNTMEGETWGVEAWTDFDVTSWWRLSAGGSILRKDFRLKPGSLDIAGFEAAGYDPDHWLKLRSQMRLTDRVDLDLGLRAYGDIPTGQASGYVGAADYVEASARLAWRVRDDLELSVVGENLLHERHPEASEARRMEIPRSVAVGLRWTR